MKTPTLRTSWTCLVLAALALSAVLVACWLAIPSRASHGGGQTPPLHHYLAKPHFSDALFDPPRCLALALSVPAEGIESLSRRPNSYVRATLDHNGHTLQEVAIKLKGGTDSFQPIDRKPSLTLNLDRYRPGQNLFGLDKIHLNNAVQDPSYLRDALASRIVAEAGIPVCRTAWATVSLNGRPLGLYFLKEGCDATFLKRYFPNAKGNFYEGEGRIDLDGSLVQQSGAGPADGSDLRRLAAACQIQEPSARLRALGKLVDVEAFLTFVALETMLGHRNGYTYGLNNYRVYAHPAHQRFVFIPAGLETTFPAHAGAPPDAVQGMLASALLDRTGPQDLQDPRVRRLVGKLRGNNTILPLFHTARQTVLNHLQQGRPEELAAAHSSMEELGQRLAALLEEPNP